MQKVRYSKANAKLQRLAPKLGLTGNIYSLDLQAGVSCLYGKSCKSQAIEVQLRDKKGQFGKKALRVKDGPNCTFRCFSASQEARIPAVYHYRRANYLAIKSAKTVNKIYSLLAESLPKDASVIRLHVSGDFFTMSYFLAICRLARNNSHITFYAYTKAIPLWITAKSVIPHNFILTASYGGKHDSMIGKHGLKSVKVVLSKYEAKQQKLPLDKDDSHAVLPTGNFALLIHGHQPAGSDAAKAWKRLGLKGYNRKDKVK